MPRASEFLDLQKKNDDAVEGVILMRRGEQTQNVLQGVEKKTEELNRSILPPDVKVRPFYDRSDLVRVTTDTVEGNLLRGMVLVLIVLHLLPGERARRPDHRAHRSAGASVRVRLPARHAAMPPICFPSAPSISASSSTAPSSWSRTSTASWTRATARLSIFAK